MKQETIYEEGIYRIIEIADDLYDIDDLCGDMFLPECFTDMNGLTAAQIAEKEKKIFIERIENEGVFGYILEKWNPEVGQGWEHVDSCFGFVGLHSDENHYIVDEFKRIIKNL